MHGNCVVIEPISKEFLVNLEKALMAAGFSKDIAVFSETGNNEISNQYHALKFGNAPNIPSPDTLKIIQKHFNPKDDEILLFIKNKADFLTKSDFLEKTIAAHLLGKFDWTYPTQSIRAFFSKDNWQVFTGKTLKKILKKKFSTHDQILSAAEVKINSRYLMALEDIRFFRRYHNKRRKAVIEVAKDKYQFQYWDKRALDYPEAGRTGYVEHYRELEMNFVLENSIPGKMLDCGCGDGKFLERIIAKNDKHSVSVGFDFSPNMLKFSNSQSASFLRINLKQLAFKKRSFDYVYAVRSVKNLPGWGLQKKAIKEIADSCNKRLVIIDSFFESYTQAIPRYNYLIREDKFLKVLKESRFRLIEKRYYPEPVRFFDYQSEPIGDEGFFVFERY